MIKPVVFFVHLPNKEILKCVLFVNILIRETRLNQRKYKSVTFFDTSYIGVINNFDKSLIKEDQVNKCEKFVFEGL